MIHRELLKLNQKIYSVFNKYYYLQYKKHDYKINSCGLLTYTSPKHISSF